METLSEQEVTHAITQLVRRFTGELQGTPNYCTESFSGFQDIWRDQVVIGLVYCQATPMQSILIVLFQPSTCNTLSDVCRVLNVAQEFVLFCLVFLVCFFISFSKV